MITLVQQVSKTSAGGSSISITIAAPAAGNTLFLLVGNSAGNQAISSVSGGGVTWSLQAQEAAFEDSEIWAGANSSGSGTTITVTPSNQFVTYDLIVAEFSGMATTLTLDGSATVDGQTGGGSSIPTGTITPTAGKSVVILAQGSSQGTIGGSPTGGFTKFTSTATQNVFAYQIVASASGSYSSILGTTAAFTHYDTTIVALDGAAVAGVNMLSGIMPGNTDGKTRGFVFRTPKYCKECSRLVKGDFCYICGRPTFC